MKILIFISFFIFPICYGEIKNNPKFIQTEFNNPDQVAGDTVGGDNGEFLRPNQPQEHIIIPLINILEAEYNPWFAPEIRKFRKNEVKEDKSIKFRAKMNKKLNEEVEKLLK